MLDVSLTLDPCWAHRTTLHVSVGIDWDSNHSPNAYPIHSLQKNSEVLSRSLSVKLNISRKALEICTPDICYVSIAENSRNNPIHQAWVKMWTLHICYILKKNPIFLTIPSWLVSF